MPFLSLDWQYHKQFKLQTILSGAPDLQRLTGLKFVLLALTKASSFPLGKRLLHSLWEHVPPQTNNREVIQLLLLSYLMPIGIVLFRKLPWLLLNLFQTADLCKFFIKEKFATLAELREDYALVLSKFCCLSVTKGPYWRRQIPKCPRPTQNSHGKGGKGSMVTYF